MTANTWFKVKGSKVRVTAYVTANTGLQTTVTSKLFDFMFDTRYTSHCILLGKICMKTEQHDVSGDFQRFLDSIAIDVMGVFQ